ncbi:MAG: EpsP synthase (3-phosphoshikimate 1-carboxyvinyltransferase), UDP-N-acetylglucosamine 1-carboxyvinyltransferase [Microgenomates group bacterium GW2011_GWC1_37_8]|uniref:UDP-N-acetylglucosamine 1-carboxyvinyltransferase n=1 Tax=Candidatus Woesebacteria bacterium GW2011_GWB1_38_8 TaxID=1618570 RepID=A0A0G0L189_9BACT|nr:MAG: EpsP synthase (3-phosphoshikimate 1-carboxyvinyltransferase), UDP-N-acetylglucosamine 1-carboxyvinyltransferase [Microgenomates group bacterium GW2011_GWC1_37_8]KKQ85713.1 MAG: EPSP synthase (3-phosphoshikimate 1-carboxyvinyltransferase) superfamily [Candidatus Woesebacteria bacterium GW2011_GWB1_38_8]
MNIKVSGKQVLSGEIYPSGSKNSAVHILAATLLFHEPVTIENIPDIKDVEKIVATLMKLGSIINWDKEKKEISIDNSSINFLKISEEDLGNMKASSLLWGGLLGRFRKVDFSELPGGCTLGIRPFEPFYKSFRDFGINVKETVKGVVMDASSAKASKIWLTEMAVSVTSTLVMISVTIKGKTRLTGVASEPQIQDLCNFLVKGGAKISGIGTNVLEIDGGHNLHTINYRILNDHYEIATFLALGACTGGEVKIHNSEPQLFPQINYEFSKFNINIEYDKDIAIVEKNQKIRFTGSFEKKTNVVRAQPWPALPVDLLPIFIPLALSAPKGYMMYHNWMYESGLFWTSELTKIGAEIIMADPHRVIVFGGNKLVGATMEAPYIIRAVVAMVMAAMIAEGKTTILNGDALYRGHPNFSGNLRKLGAVIEEII